MESSKDEKKDENGKNCAQLWQEIYDVCDLC